MRQAEFQPRLTRWGRVPMGSARMERRRGRWRPADRDGERHRAHKDNRRVWWCGVWHFPLVSCLSSYGEHHCESEFHRADLLFGNLLHGCSKLHARWFREFDGSATAGTNSITPSHTNTWMTSYAENESTASWTATSTSYWFCPARQFGGVRRYVLWWIQAVRLRTDLRTSRDSLSRPPTAYGIVSATLIPYAAAPAGPPNLDYQFAANLKLTGNAIFDEILRSSSSESRPAISHPL